MISFIVPAHNEDNSPVNVDAILLSILGTGAQRFGMAAAALQGERIIAQGGAGVRKRGSAERITLDNQFHLGSCTKAMTATLVAMFVENGKLNWTTTLGELFAATVKAMHGVGASDLAAGSRTPRRLAP